jgi:hypothetical protein
MKSRKRAGSQISTTAAAGTWSVFLFLAFGCCFMDSVQAEIIDRIRGVVGNQIITQSDIREERNLRAALGEAAEADTAILQSLVEELLIEDQMLQFPGVEVAASEIEAELSMVQDRHGLPLQVIEDGIRRRFARMRFFELRFRQFITASSEEIQQYYETVFVPEAQARGLRPIPPLQEVADLVRSNVVNEKLSTEVETWLEAVRGRSNVEVFE